MKIKITKRGTHMVPLGEINNDIASSPSVVANCISDLSFYLKEMVRKGGSDHDASFIRNRILWLNRCLLEAKSQGWELELETNE